MAYTAPTSQWASSSEPGCFRFRDTEVSLSSAVSSILCGDFSLCWRCFCFNFGHLKLLFGLRQRRVRQGLRAELDNPRLPRFHEMSLLKRCQTLFEIPPRGRHTSLRCWWCGCLSGSFAPFQYARFTHYK